MIVLADGGWGSGPIVTTTKSLVFTYKKENKIFLTYKEIQEGSGAKSYMTNGLLIYDERFAHFLKY